MKLNPITTNFESKYKPLHVPKSPAKDVLGYRNPNVNKFVDYTNELKIQLTNTIYNRRKGVGEHSVSGYAYAAKFFNIKNLITLGGESAVFTLRNGDILKISVNKYNDYLPEFHAPEVTRGFVRTHKKHRIFDFFKNKETNTLYYVIQKCGNFGVDEKDEKALIQKVKDAGYDLCDVKWDQIAYFDINGNQEARFVDLGCIVPKGCGW